MRTKKIARASTITIISTIASLILGVLIQSLIGRIFGPKGVGLYASFMMFVNIYSLIAVFGLPIALSKYIAEYEEKGEDKKIIGLLTFVVLFSTVTSIIVGAMSYFITPFLAKIIHIDSTFGFTLFVLITLLFFNYSRITQSFFQGLLQVWKSSFIQIVSLVGILSIVVLTYFKPAPLYFAIAFGYIISGFVGILLCKDKLKSSLLISNKLILETIKFSLPIAVITQLFFVSQWIDRFALGLYFGVTEIGIFTVALTVIQALLQVPMSLGSILLPAYSKINTYGAEKIEKAFNLNVKIFASFLFLGSALVFLFANEIIYILFSSKSAEFKPAILLIRILSINLFFSALTIPASNLITGSGRPKLVAIASFAGIILQFVFIILLTKRFGMVGTAAGRSCALLAIVLLDIYMVIHFLKIKFNWINFLNPLLIFLVSVSIFFIFQSVIKNIFIAGFLLVVTYFILTWRIIFKLEEKKFLIKMIPFEIGNVIE